MKKTGIYMVILALLATPLLAQDPEPTEPAEPSEEEQIERAIEEALGETETKAEPVVQEEVSLVDQEPMQEEVYYDDNRPKRREVQTLMSGGGGGFGALSFGYTQVDGVDAFQMGARAEWVIGHGFGLGIAGVGFTSDFKPVGTDYWAMSGGYGGLVMEPIIMGWLPVHITLPVLIGGGGMASYANNGDPWDYVDPLYSEYSVFFVTEVGAELEFNLVRFFRLALFGTYRWTTDLDMKSSHGLLPPDPSDPNYFSPGADALRSWSAGVRFKFGSF